LETFRLRQAVQIAYNLGIMPTSKIPSPYAPPIVVVGTVALDIIHFWNEDRTAQQVRVELGGVCKHVACALGNMGAAPRLVTTRFSGELGVNLASLLHANQVEWLPLAASAPLSLFEAHLDVHDHVFDETFTEGESLELLTPTALRSYSAFADARVIVTCTNLSAVALNELAQIAHERSAPFWLLSSSTLGTPKIAQIKPPLDLVSLNIEELQWLVGYSLETLPQIATAALQSKPMADKYLVTLGSRGALFCERGAEHVLYQPVEPLAGRSPVGGGDVLFAGLLGAKVQGRTWDEALAFGAACAQAYLLRDPHSATPYANLALPPESALPPIERIPF
jgi:sugar/nucleoside kinase (ribokinase family)